YVLNVSYHKSTDGGKSFVSSNAPHGDHHDLWIAPEDPKRMIIGDDGGAQVSYDGGENWSTYHNQPTAQFYRLTTDNHFPYRIYAAQQDNSTIRIEHRSEGRSINEENWEETAGGESAHIAVDPTNDEIVYGGSYGGFLTRVNHEKGTTRGINVWPDNPMGHGAEDMKYRFQWNFPIIFSKHNPKKLYTFSNHVHLTTTEGASWETISPDLTRNDATKLGVSGGPITKDNTGVEYYATIFAANESPLKEGLIWVGSDDGLIHLTQDGGKNWENVTPKNMPEWMMINSVEPSVFDAGTCYVAGTRYKLGDFEPYLYKTTDFGKTWTLITNGIAKEHFTRVVREDPKQKGLLYAGTENGMYISYDDGANWESFQRNLPIVPITDLLVRDNNLIVATQGRSIWMIDDLSVVHQLKEAAGKENFLFQPKDSYRMGGGSRSGSLTEGTNHPNGVMTYFYVTDAEKEVKLEFLNAQGDTIKTYSNKSKSNKLDVKKGSNLFVWNTVSDGAESFQGMILWWARLTGAKAVPGNYQVRLKSGDFSQTQSFKILPDPNSEASVADMQKQYDFINEVNATVTEAHKTIKKIRKIREQLNAFEKQYKDNEAVKVLMEKSKEMKKGFSEVEEALYQTQNRSGQDPLNFPIRLTNKLAHLNSLVGLDDFGPTEQDIAVKDELTTQIRKQLSAFNQLVDSDVAAFNSEFNKLNLKYLFIEN
ncbi:MAG: glycosyl hydrolase, partial [Flavobacteriaceae bacterium]|nr:glycosyl hydrolase [Flavobacteriaceae bacterium]